MTGTSHDSGGAGRGHRDDISLVQVATLLLRHRRVVAGSTIVAAAVVAAATLMWPRFFTAEASFLPEQGGASLSAISSVAAQFGFTVPAAEGGDSPAFYADLLTSRVILHDLVATPYVIGRGHDGDSLRLSAYFHVGDESSPEVLDRTIEKLRKRIAVGTDRETGMVAVRVETTMPELSYQVVARMLELLSDFNLQRRQTRASAERAFVGERLDAATTELRDAEDKLQAFLARNREFRTAPQLLFQYERLQRSVDMHQQVYTSLAQAYEQARIEEVRNTPVITIVEEPVVPPRPDRRRLALKTLLAGVAGAMIGIALAVVAEVLRRQQDERPDEFAALRTMRSEVEWELKRPWRLLLPRRARNS